jgi:quercetin dioxygenase-like cupin family protein
MKATRLYTGPDGRSHVETVDLPFDAARAAVSVRIAESPPGSALDWHDAPARQLVVTLTGTLDFTTRDGETFTLGPGDVLLAEDTAGSGHRWTLVGPDPWLRVYVVLGEG